MQFHDSSTHGALIVNFGAGVDSTGILVGLAKRYLTGDLTARPDLILFADTGGEMPSALRNVRLVSAWCIEMGFPAITTVKRWEVIRQRGQDRGLYDMTVRNATLPSEAFGGGSCSIKAKHDPMDRFLQGYVIRRGLGGWLEQNGWADQRPTRCIGYDADEALKGKRGKNAKKDGDALNRYRYPLVEWGWTRDDCIREIKAAGLPVPRKSSCWFCPNCKEDELRQIHAEAPQLLVDACAMEELARRGKHGLGKIEGLWRKGRKYDQRPGSWLTWGIREGLVTRAQVEARMAQLIAKHGLVVSP